jgi:hypothetical protein
MVLMVLLLHQLLAEQVEQVVLVAEVVAVVVLQP